MPITRAVPVPTPYVKKVPIIRKIPVPVPNKKSVPDTKLVNETNVKIVGYQKTKVKSNGKEIEESCSIEETIVEKNPPQGGALDYLKRNGIGETEIA